MPKVYGCSCTACGRTKPINWINYTKNDYRCDDCISKGKKSASDLTVGLQAILLLAIIALIVFLS